MQSDSGRVLLEGMQNASGQISPCVLLNVTHGFQARLLLRSEIANYLLNAGCKLVVCSPNADETYFAEEFGHPQITLETIPTVTSNLELRLASWRQYLLMNPSLGGTLNHKREALKAEMPKRYALTRSANLLLGNLPILRRLYMAMEQRLFPAREYDELLIRHKPDLCVTGTPGFNTHDVHLLRACKRNQIPTACVMLSWDNLTSKGYMNGVPDHLLVWSDLMAEEAESYHDYPRESIVWTGAAQFDHYYQAHKDFDSIAWRKRNGVPKNAFLMMYGTINPGICGHEIEIVRELIRDMRKDAGERPNFLWIRLHPQVVDGPWSRSLDEFKSLAASDVYVEVPPVNVSKLHWDLPKHDAGHLRDLILASDLVVTTSSTLSIDAVSAGTPIANVFFDGIEVPAVQSVSRFKNYTHYAKILATGGIDVADSIEEFREIRNKYLESATANSDGRKAIEMQQLNRLDGQAGRRTAQAILKLCENPR